jgi:integrase
MVTQAESEQNNGQYDDFFDFLGNKSESTISGYRSVILSFFKTKYPDYGVNKDNISVIVDGYLNNNPDVVTDLVNFFKSGDQSNKTRSGAGQRFRQLTGFFDYVWRDLTKKERGKITNQFPRKQTSNGTDDDAEPTEGTLTPDIINAMINHTDIKGKAIIMMLTTTGLRIGELLSLKVKDVELTTPETIKDLPVTVIRVRKSKNGYSRFTFCTSETTEAVRQWLKVRSQYIQENKNRGLNLYNDTQMLNGTTVVKTEKVDDGRLFPLSEKSVTDLLADVCKKISGSNQRNSKTRRSLIHAHLFRKFMMSRLAHKGGMEKAPIDLITGHITQLDRTYLTQTTAEDVAPLYKAAEWSLYVESTSENRKTYVDNNEKFQKINNDRVDMMSDIRRLEREKKDLQDEMQGQIDDLKSAVDALITVVKSTKEYERTVKGQTVNDLPDSIGASEE